MWPGFHYKKVPKKRLSGVYGVKNVSNMYVQFTLAALKKQIARSASL